MKQIFTLLILFGLIGIAPVKADPEMSLEQAMMTPAPDSSGLTAKYGKKGFEFRTGDNMFSLQLRSRLQFRFLTPYPSNPRSIEDMNDDPITTFRVNRSRLKVGGHGFKPWLKYYWEYDVGQGRLLDFRLMVEKWKGFSIKVGQWKIDYTRERTISSGKQQHVDRSIINRPFTLDRQQGICFYGHLEGGGAADFKYWVSVLTGTGRESRSNDDENLLYVGRFQWNPLNGGTDFSGSDTKISEKPRLSLALAAATNTSQHTRFSSGGGGNLDGFSTGAPGQYELMQGLVEASFKYRGFSFEHEYHMKDVKDKIEDTETSLSGYYVQAGYFLGQCFDFVPEPLELAVRYANYTPNTEFDAYNSEITATVNWFFKGHNNKLTADVSFFEIEEVSGDTDTATRVRVQWDISF